jgi:hypothetical protein
MRLSLCQLRESKRAIEQSSVLRECPSLFLVDFLAGLPILCADAVEAGATGELHIGALLAKIIQQHIGASEVCVGALAVLVAPDADVLYDDVVCSRSFAQVCFAAQQRWPHCDALAFAVGLVVARASRCRARNAQCEDRDTGLGEGVRGMMAVMRGSSMREVQEVCVTYFVDACLREPALAGGIARAGGARRALALLRQASLSASGALLCLSFVRMLLVFADPLHHGITPAKLYASLSAELGRLLRACEGGVPVLAASCDLVESIALTMVILADVSRAATRASVLDLGRCADVLARALNTHANMDAATVGVVVSCLDTVCPGDALPPALETRAAVCAVLTPDLGEAAALLCLHWLSRMPDGVGELARSASCAQLLVLLRSTRSTPTAPLGFLRAVFAAGLGDAAEFAEGGGLCAAHCALQCADGHCDVARATFYAEAALLLLRAALPLRSPRLCDDAVGLLLCVREWIPESSPLDEQVVALLVTLL